MREMARARACRREMDRSLARNLLGTIFLCEAKVSLFAPRSCSSIAAECAPLTMINVRKLVAPLLRSGHSFDTPSHPWATARWLYARRETRNRDRIEKACAALPLPRRGELSHGSIGARD